MAHANHAGFFHHFWKEPERTVPRSTSSAASWAVVGVVAVAAAIALSMGNEMQRLDVSTTTVGAMNIATPTSGALIPMSTEREFLDLFVQEKRQAQVVELPEQF